MSTPLPVGILIPTRNAAALWRDHLPQLQQVIEVAEEVVVVDSESNDGTVEMFRTALHHPRLRFFARPPGLYASWNFGLAQIGARHSYIATAGDTTTPAGLRRLCDLATQFDADVMLSVPGFVDDAGTPHPKKRWPIHDLLDDLKISAPAALTRSQGFIACVLQGASGIMGSSASNLYRTIVMQARPFATDFGHIGDTAWGTANSIGVRFAVTPEVCASFVLHEKVRPISVAEQTSIEDRLLAIARRSLRDALASDSVPPDAAALEKVFDHFAALRASFRPAKDAYDTARKQNPLWILQPSVWRARRERNRIRRALRALWHDTLRDVCF